jgi:NitT/TauT family transport system permease protein
MKLVETQSYKALWKRNFTWIKDWLMAGLIFLITIILWEAIVNVMELPPYLLPAPSVVLRVISQRWVELLGHVGWTMLEAVSGFLIGCTLAFFSAILFVHVRLFERSLYPWAVILQTIPIVALSPLFAIWLGYGLSHKIAIAAVISFFPVLVSSTRGLRDVSPQAFELMEILSASKVNIFFRLRLPSSLPHLFAGLKISSTLAVIGAIIAEFNGASQGIGYLVYVAGYQINTRLIFAGITFSSLAGIVFFQSIVLLEKLLLRWPGAELRE